MININVRVKEVANIKKQQARNLITGICNGKLFIFFEDPITGTVNITYPLKNPDYFEVENEESIGGLLWSIAKRYEQIYKEEAKTSSKKEVNNAPLLNRSETDGKYGIYGHHIDDLFFEGIEIDENNIIILYMGS